MSKYCDDCGCHVTRDFCENCDESIFIREQYFELNLEVPDLINEECAEIIKRRGL